MDNFIIENTFLIVKRLPLKIGLNLPKLSPYPHKMAFFFFSPLCNATFLPFFHRLPPHKGIWEDTLKNKPGIHTAWFYQVSL